MKKSIKQICQLLSATVVFMLLSLGAWAQTVVTGKVNDSKEGTGVSGVTVSVKGTQVSTQTGPDGSYKITVPSGSNTLVFTSVGYARQERPVGANVDVNFVATTQALNEVVVVGYGTARKKDLTGSMTIVSAKDFQKGQVATPEQLILGKVAGVSITSNGGAPGAGSTIRIRGGASLAAANDPLIIVDGVQLGGGIAGSANPLALINPNDIETFSVLKDASAAAIYGSRASNGVIIITTKKGRKGKAQISFQTNLSVGQVSKLIDVLSPNEFRDYVNANGDVNQKALLGTANTNWQDEIYQTAIGTDNNLSISGATKGKLAMPYRVSMGYFNQDGILRTGNIQRWSGAVNLSPRFFNDHLKVDLNLKGTNTKSRFANEGAIGAAVTFDPTQPVYSGSQRFGGYWEWLDPSSVTGLRALSPSNPVALLQERDDRSNVNRSIGNLVLDYKFHFLPELRANINVGYDVAEGTGTILVNDSVRQAYMRDQDTANVQKGGIRNQYRQRFQNTQIEYYLNYAKDIKKLKSRVDVTLGGGYYNNLYINTFYPDYFYDGSKRKNSDPQFPDDRPQSRLISFYGRLVYTLNNKYIFTFTGRTDGSSRLNPENRWLTYHSEAFAWKISEEDFLKNSKVISDLKLRAAYGITGQQDGIGLYSYLPNYALSNLTAQYQFGNNFFTMYRPLAYNDKLRWEQTATTNIAVDFGFFDQRITGSVDFYVKKTKDLLNNVNQSAGTNFAPQVLSNVGTMENRGVELLINTQVVRKTDLTVDFGFNLTYNRNRITRLTFTEDPNYPGQQFGGISGGTGNSVLINSVGFPRGSFFVYQQVYDQAGNPIENVFEDRNRDGQITDKDLYRYKSANPDVFMGFNGNVNYKKWNAGFIMRASLGNYMYNNVFSSTGTLRNILNPLNYLANGSRNVLESGFVGNGQRYFLSDYYVQNASFLRMDNISVGYNFGKVFQGKATLRANANVQNVFVITKYKGADPEGFGIDNNFYPRPRTYVLGLNLDF